MTALLAAGGRLILGVATEVSGKSLTSIIAETLAGERLSIIDFRPSKSTVTVKGLTLIFSSLG